MRRYAIRLLRPMLLMLALGLANGPALAQDIPTKIIRIYNNSDVRIFPVFETSQNSVDEWLQAYFKVTKVKRDTFPRTRTFRLYIKPNAGIAPGEHVALRVPLFTQLVKNPDPTKPNQYISWWNGMRIYMYDVKKTLQERWEDDKKNPVESFVTPSITCIENTKCGDMRVYSSTMGLPGGDPNMFVEYTFGDAITAVAPPYRFQSENVGYNISYVDSVYLPAAMGPIGNKQIGYIGSTLDLTSFRKILRQFLNRNPGWPYFASTRRARPKIPGAYVALLGGADLVFPEGDAVRKMKQDYLDCLDDSNPAGRCKKIFDVTQLFRDNYRNYEDLECQHLPLTNDLLLQHVYGWVPFNENCKGQFNDLARTPGAGRRFNELLQTYIDLQYSDGFNPYTHLIHDEDKLNMDAYAFSVDDAVGFMHERGNGLVITIGGAKGLENTRRFNSKWVLNVALGNDPSRPRWRSYGICTDTPDEQLDEHPAFQIATMEYPCRITLRDARNRAYSFIAASGPPGNPATLDCTGSVSPAWCRAINVSKDRDSGRWVFNTPPTDPVQ